MVQAYEEIVGIVSEDLPVAFQLLKEMNENVTHVGKLVESMLFKVRQGELSTDNGLSFLEVKYHMLLNYLINITYIVLRKASGRSIECDPAIERLVEIRTVLEKMRPIENKLRYTIDKMVKTAATGALQGSDGSQFKANPANMMNKLDDSDESDDEGRRPMRYDRRGSGLYVPPKMTPMHYDGDQTPVERQTKILARAKKRAMNSSVIRELREEYLETPHELTERSTVNAVVIAKRQTQEQYEEDNMVRLPQSKQQKQRDRYMSTVNSIGDELTRFPDITALTGGKGAGGKRKAAKGMGKKVPKKKKKHHH